MKYLVSPNSCRWIGFIDDNPVNWLWVNHIDRAYRFKNKQDALTWMMKTFGCNDVAWCIQ